MYHYVVWSVALSIFAAALMKALRRSENAGGAALAPDQPTGWPEPPLQQTPFSVVDLNAGVQEVQALLERVTRKDIAWVTRLDPRAPRIEANFGQIHQALTNLVLNACGAMPDGGVLTIETVSVCIGENPPAARRKAVAGHYALLAVTDTGSGFTENGSLAIVRRIVTEAGGWMQEHSESAKGSRFEIYLPQIS